MSRQILAEHQAKNARRWPQKSETRRGGHLAGLAGAGGARVFSKKDALSSQESAVPGGSQPPE